MTPLLFASLAVAVAFKAGLFNIGVSGMMLAAGFTATVIIGYSGMSSFLARPLVLLIGIAVGSLMGAFVGWLKYKFNINEVVSTIMLNNIAQYVFGFFINTSIIDPVSRQSKYIPDSSRLTLVNVELGGLKMDIPLGFLLALAAALFIRFFMDKTVLGYEIKTVGSNRNAAKYAGINVGRNIILAMMISGALAGLAGVTFYNSNPVGIVFSSLLISIISKGSTYMSSIAGIDQDIASVITGLILLFSACGEYIKYKIRRVKEKPFKRKESEA